MITIEKRAQSRDTCGFVTPETVDTLAVKLIGMVDDRRMAMTRRYLGDRPGTPDVLAGLRVDWRGFSPVSHRRGVGVGIHLTPGINGVGFSMQRTETEEEARERYHSPDKQWLGQRRDLVYVELRGWAGQPHREDKIRIERWNEHGVGEEIIVVFDDLDMLEEIAWDIKKDRERQVHMWDEFCTVCDLHFEHHLHHRSTACKGRPPTRGETLAALAANALKAEAEAN